MNEVNAKFVRHAMVTINEDEMVKVMNRTIEVLALMGIEIKKLIECRLDYDNVLGRTYACPCLKAIDEDKEEYNIPIQFFDMIDKNVRKNWRKRHREQEVIDAENREKEEQYRLFLEKKSRYDTYLKHKEDKTEIPQELRDEFDNLTKNEIIELLRDEIYYDED